jgi:hypothetical protein
MLCDCICSIYVSEQGGEKGFPVAHFDSLASPFAKATEDEATSLETPKKSSTYLRGYAAGFFGVSASFRLNSQNAHDGIFFHHPAGRWNKWRVLSRGLYFQSLTGRFLDSLDGPLERYFVSLS